MDGTIIQNLLLSKYAHDEFVACKIRLNNNGESLSACKRTTRENCKKNVYCSENKFKIIAIESALSLNYKRTEHNHNCETD